MVSKRVRTLIQEITLSIVKDKFGGPTKFLNSKADDIKMVSLDVKKGLTRWGWGLEGSFDDFKNYMTPQMRDRFDKTEDALGLRWDKMIMFRHEQHPSRGFYSPVQYAAQGTSNINNQIFTIDALSGSQSQIIKVRSGKSVKKADDIMGGRVTINDFKY